MGSPFVFPASPGVILSSKQSLVVSQNAALLAVAITPVLVGNCAVVMNGFKCSGAFAAQYVPNAYPGTIVSGKYTEVFIESQAYSAAIDVEVDVFDLIGLKSINYYQMTASGGAGTNNTIASVNTAKSEIIQMGNCRNSSGWNSAKWKFTSPTVINGIADNGTYPVSMWVCVKEYY